MPDRIPPNSHNPFQYSPHQEHFSLRQGNSGRRLSGNFDYSPRTGNIPTSAQDLYYSASRPSSRQSARPTDMHTLYNTPMRPSSSHSRPISMSGLYSTASHSHAGSTPGSAQYCYSTPRPASRSGSISMTPQTSAAGSSQAYYATGSSRLYAEPAANMASVSSSTRSAYLSQQIQRLTLEIANRTRLSTTGYQVAMRRVNNPDTPDSSTLMKMRRAQQYINTAKQTFPAQTLKSLAELQASTIYRTSNGELRGGVEMSPQQLTECLQKCRQTGFANCDIQALETALHLKYRLGINDFTIFSNHKLSHNYVVINPCQDFPKGAIVDPWTGGEGPIELNFRTKMMFKHQEQNIQKNENMHQWIEQQGHYYVLPG